MIKNIVFDLGGVVLEWNMESLEDRHPEFRDIVKKLITKKFFENYWSSFDRGSVTQDEIVCQIENLVEVPYCRCWDFVESIKHSLVNIPKTENLIKELKKEGYSVYCLSNMSLEYYNYMKDRELFTFFDGKIISALEHTIKPEKEIYELLLSRFNLKGEECVFIDDLSANLRAAEAFGIKTVLFEDREKGYALLNALLHR